MAQNRYQGVSRPEGLKMSLSALLAELSLADIPQEVLDYCISLLKTFIPPDPVVTDPYSLLMVPGYKNINVVKNSNFLIRKVTI